jgi:hypothetical protein
MKLDKGRAVVRVPMIKVKQNMLAMSRDDSMRQHRPRYLVKPTKSEAVQCTPLTTVFVYRQYMSTNCTHDAWRSCSCSRDTRGFKMAYTTFMRARTSSRYTCGK